MGSSTFLPPMLEAKLQRVAQEHRRRSQLRQRLRAGAFFLALVASLVVGLWLSEFAEWPFVVPCAAILLVSALVFYRWLRASKRRELAIEEVAELVDRHYPELENLVVSSVEFSRDGYRAPSEWIVARVLENADWHSRDIAIDTLADTRSLRRLKLGGLALWSAVLALLLLLVGQVDFARLRAGFFVPIAYVELPFVVEPGDVRVRYGGEQTVWVRGADPDESAALRWRRAEGQWQTASLLPGRVEGVHHFRLRNLLGDVEYQVQVGSRRSKSYRIEVWMPPEVEEIALRYRYPDYLGLEPREVVGGGHITALVGSEVELEVAVDKALEGAELVFESGERLALVERAEQIWVGKVSVQRDDFYWVELRDKEGNENEMPTRYRIVASPDEPPELKVQFPRGDDEATALEEIEFSFGVSDDYGLRAYGLEYEVAGRDKVRLTLGAEGLKETQRKGEYLLALEELDLRAGDLLTWTLWAEDYKPDRSAYETLGDPYFLEIRPFSRDYSEAISNEGAAAQGGANGGPAADQKQIVIATWNLRRDAETLTHEEFVERRERIEVAQRAILQQASELRPPPGREELVATLRGEIAGALTALAAASEPDSTATLTRAMGHEQRAYHYLLQLEPEDRQLTQSNSQQGGGGGQSDSARNRELEALETSRRRDFREEASTLGEQMQAAEEARDSLEELARRQEFLNEDMAELVSDLQSEDEEVRAEAQRQLAELRSEQRRAQEELDRVGGEIASGDLESGQRAELRQQLQEARRQMERSAEELERGETQRARAAGRRAQEALNRAERDLDQLSRGGLAQRLEQLGRGLDSLRVRQDAVGKEQRRARGEAATKQEELAEDFARFMGEAGELAERSGQDLVSRKLGDWLRQTSRQGIYEDMRESGRQARYGAGSDELLEEVGRKLALAGARLDSLQRYLALDDLDARRKALAQLRDLSARALGAARGGEGTEDSGGVREGQSASERGQAGVGGDSLGGREIAAGGGLRSAAADDGRGEGGAAPGGEGAEMTGAGGQTGDGGEGEVPINGGRQMGSAQNGGRPGSPNLAARNWREALRDARDLLPEDSAAREILGDLSAGASGFEGDKALPQYDLLYERAKLPLQRAAEVLEREIEVLRGEREIPPVDVREVPPRYRQQVAKYFERLAELEGE